MFGVEAVGALVNGTAKFVRAENAEATLDYSARALSRLNGVVEKDPDFIFGAMSLGLDMAKFVPVAAEVGVHSTGVLRAVNHVGNNRVSRWLGTKTLQAGADIAGVANAVMPNKWFGRAKAVAELGQQSLDDAGRYKKTIDRALKYAGEHPEQMRTAAAVLQRTAGAVKRGHENIVANPTIAEDGAKVIAESARLAETYSQYVQRLAAQSPGS